MTHSAPSMESSPGGRRRGPAIVVVVVAALTALLLAVSTACAGGGRSGTDQPGTQGTDTTQPVSINDSSERDLGAALRADGVSTPENWAQTLGQFKPYPAGEAGKEKIQQVLQQFKADQDTVDRITRTVVP